MRILNLCKIIDQISDFYYTGDWFKAKKPAKVHKTIQRLVHMSDKKSSTQLNGTS